MQGLVVQGEELPKKIQSASNTHKEYFKKDYAMQGLFSESEETFYIEDWDVEGCTLTLKYNITQIVDTHLSDMTLSINDVRFYTQRLSYETGANQQIKIEIPKEHLKEGINTVKVESYIRTQEGLPCVDDVSTANWMNIYKESNVNVTYKPRINIESIADFYKWMTSIYGAENKKCVVAVPPKASDETLGVALNTLAGLAPRLPLYYDRVDFEVISKLEQMAGRNFIVYIATLEELPPPIRGLLETKELEQAKHKALMKLVKVQEDRNILLIVGDDSEALTKAGQLMGNTVHMQQLTGKQKWIMPTEDVATRLEEDFQYYELTKQGSYVDGPFRQTMSFYIDFPKNRSLAQSSQIYLDLRYSENLDFDRSLVTVYINDYPVGSKKLSLEDAVKDEVILDIPMDIQLSGSFELKVAFDLEIKDLWCTLRQGETPWAFVSSESMLKLNTLQNPSLDFKYYPAPFVKDYQFNQVNIIVPDEIGKAEYDILGPLALTMGRFVKDNKGSLKVTRVSQAKDLKEDNLIVVGTFEDNAIVRDLNDKLAFKVSEDGEAILPNDQQSLEAAYSKTLGTGHLLTSPYGEDQQAVLVISGVNEKGMLEAASYLGALEGLWHLSGDSYIANAEMIKAYTFKEKEASKLPFQQKSGDKEAGVSIGIAALVLGIMLIVMSLLFILKYKKGGR